MLAPCQYLSRITTASQLINHYSYVSHHSLALINRDAWGRMKPQPPSQSIQKLSRPTLFQPKRGKSVGPKPASPLHPKCSACNRLFLLNNNGSCRASFPPAANRLGCSLLCVQRHYPEAPGIPLSVANRWSLSARCQSSSTCGFHSPAKKLIA